MMDDLARDRMSVSPRWMRAIILTFLIGFAILGYLAIRVYQDHPPVPGQVVSERGEALFTGDDIRDGQELFLTYGLMQYGSIYGHGAYFGPDFTSENTMKRRSSIAARAVAEDWGRTPSAIPINRARSWPSSPGRPGRRPPGVPGILTPVRIIGPPKR